MNNIFGGCFGLKQEDRNVSKRADNKEKTKRKKCWLRRLWSGIFRKEKKKPEDDLLQISTSFVPVASETGEKGNKTEDKEQPSVVEDKSVVESKLDTTESSSPNSEIEIIETITTETKEQEFSPAKKSKKKKSKLTDVNQPETAPVQSESVWEILKSSNEKSETEIISTNILQDEIKVEEPLNQSLVEVCTAETNEVVTSGEPLIEVEADGFVKFVSEKELKERESALKETETISSMVFVKSNADDFVPEGYIQVTGLDDENGTVLKSYADIAALRKEETKDISKSEPTSPQKKEITPVKISIEVIGEPKKVFEPLPADSEGFIAVLNKRERRERSRSRQRENINKTEEFVSSKECKEEFTQEETSIIIKKNEEIEKQETAEFEKEKQKVTEVLVEPDREKQEIKEVCTEPDKEKSIATKKSKSSRRKRSKTPKTKVPTVEKEVIPEKIKTEIVECTSKTPVTEVASEETSTPNVEKKKKHKKTKQDNSSTSAVVILSSVISSVKSVSEFEDQIDDSGSPKKKSPKKKQNRTPVQQQQQHSSVEPQQQPVISSAEQESIIVPPPEEDELKVTITETAVINESDDVVSSKKKSPKKKPKVKKYDTDYVQQQEEELKVEIIETQQSNEKDKTTADQSIEVKDKSDQKKKKKSKKQKSENTAITSIEKSEEIQTQQVSETLIVEKSEITLPDKIYEAEFDLVKCLQLDGPFWIDKPKYLDAERDWQIYLAQKNKKLITNEIVNIQHDKSPDKDDDNDSDSSGGGKSPALMETERIQNERKKNWRLRIAQLLSDYVANDLNF